MEACVRGFSYMSEAKVEEDLQLIEGGELERAWKTRRRQRIKQQEQKIWDEFVKEQDMVRSVLDDDPYQFLEHLPEACLKELMEKELNRMRKEKEVEEVNNEQQALQKGSGDTATGGVLRSPPGGRPPAPPAPPPLPAGPLLTSPVPPLATPGSPPLPPVVPAPPAVTFADQHERHCDMFHVFEDDKDEETSGIDCVEEEVAAESGSACTVLEREDDDDGKLSPTTAHTERQSSENVTTMIESSIYCAKVKDLRAKINEELIGIISFLEQQDISRMQPEELVRASRRSSEFSARFNRIYIYQLQRQTHDIKRNNKLALPFAKHTQFQSQMVRIVSLHQNMLQAIQVFRRSVEAVGCGSGACACLRGAARLLRDAAQSAQPAQPAQPEAQPAHLADLYNDEILATCDKLDDEIDDYLQKLNDYTTNMENQSSLGSKRMPKMKNKKRPIGVPNKPSAKTLSETEARLSMYSLETLRTNLNTKSSTSNNNSSGTSKMHGLNKRGVDKGEQTPRNTRKSPRCLWPLMRAPGRRPRARAARDNDVRTLVETVHVCTSSHISREGSPRCSPRSRDRTPKKCSPSSPRSRFNVSPKAKHRRSSPKPTQALKAVLSSIKSDLHDSLASPHVQISPVSKIKCARRRKKSIQEVQEADTDTKEIEKSISVNVTPRVEEKEKRDKVINERKERERDKKEMLNMAPARCEVTRLLRQLCGGDASGSRNERVSGAKNAQLLCVNGGSPRQPSTPQLLRILEETIQKKVPKHLFHKPSSSEKNKDRLRLTFNISEKTSTNLFQYRTKFVQHMLTSPMYANSAVGKPWEMIGSISEQIIDDLILECAKEMQLEHVVRELYEGETC